MNQRPLLFGCLSILLGVSSASSAGEFTLYDPGISPNIKMDCDAKHYAEGSWQTSRRSSFIWRFSSRRSTLSCLTGTQRTMLGWI